MPSSRGLRSSHTHTHTGFTCGLEFLSQTETCHVNQKVTNEYENLLVTTPEALLSLVHFSGKIVATKAYFLKNFKHRNILNFVGFFCHYRQCSSDIFIHSSSFFLENRSVE